MSCLHCGSNKQIYYCEDCFQRLIVKNLELQMKINELKEQLQKEHEPKHMQEEKTKMMYHGGEIDKHIPYID